jgi:4-amino-4-deoxy-L-arabinose transferase-like glycosyltransferase
MKKTMHLLLVITAVLSGLVSFLYLSMRNRDTLGEYYATSSINVEIDKAYTQNIAVAIETSPNPCSYWLSPTTSGDSGANTVIMHINIPLKRPFWNPAIQFPEAVAADALAHIDNIALFIGNKLFYFSHDEVQRFRRDDKDGYALFYLPDAFYAKSLVFKNWRNYYGDINFGIKALSAFFLYPARYAATWFSLALLLFLCRKDMLKVCLFLARHKKITARILLAIILCVGFILRFNGYTRHSGWTDEIYSATVAANPNLPFINTFTDTGNPPFYFILLRCWFKLFGWTEEAGTLLSVLLGTFSALTLYMLVKPFGGRKAALLAAFLIAISGFSIGYSQEMRAYILKMFLVPLVSLAFLRYLKQPSIKNCVLYILPSVCIVNSHYYGVIFIMAIFFFYLLWLTYNKAWSLKPVMIFSIGNAIVAASFLPFFLYMLIYKNYDFSREFTPQIGHTFLFCVIVMLVLSFFVFKKELINACNKFKILNRQQSLFVLYITLIPVFIFILAYGVSFFKPMISFRYLWPINTSLMFALVAVIISAIGRQKKTRALEPVLIYIFAVGLNGIIPDIPSGGTEGYKEARAYIAADAAAHKNEKAAMLDNSPQSSAYYGFDVLPLYSADTPYDVLYVYNDIFNMHEIDMYDRMRSSDIDDNDVLKVYFDYTYPRGDGGMIIKKYLK